MDKQQEETQLKKLKEQKEKATDPKIKAAIDKKIKAFNEPFNK